MSENFFGGFKKDDEESKRLNRKQWIDELILKSKQLKVSFLILKYIFHFKVKCIHNSKSMNVKKKETKLWI